MSKQQIRVAMRRKNLNVEPQTRRESAEKLFSQIENSSIFATSHTIALYSALPDELPTSQVIERWCKMGKTILLPRVECDERMEFYLYSDTQNLTPGEFGILEPATRGAAFEPYKIDLMILPGVAFCSDGRRLGRGRGYYDRYLSREGFSAHTIGVCYPHQIVDELECEPHDVSLNEVVTGEDGADHNSKITIPSLILSIIEAAGVDAARLGCSVAKLNELGLSWVLLNLAVEMEREPEAGEKIVIDTWINDCNRVSTTRNFILKNSRDEQIGVASTMWCIIDLATRRSVNLMTSEINYSQYITPRSSTITIERRLSSFDAAAGVAESQHLATERDIDFNNHVNTIRYIEMMLEQLPEEYRSIVAPTRCDFNFASESRLGDMLTVKHQTCDCGDVMRSLFEIVREDGVTSVKAQFKFRK